MRKVYEDQSMPMVECYRILLSEEGIETSIQNEFAHLAAGRIPFTQVYPELWVLDEEDYERAIALIRAVREPALDSSVEEKVEYQQPLVLRIFLQLGLLFVALLLLGVVCNFLYSLVFFFKEMVC